MNFPKLRSMLLVLLLPLIFALFVVSAHTKQSSGGSQSETPTAPPAGAQAKPAVAPLVGDMVIEPDDLAKALQSPSGTKPLIVHVGFHILYTQAHITGSEYLGPASKEDGLAVLRKGLESVSRKQYIVLYCGCCPWTHCPNVKPAYEAVRAMGFTNVKVLHIDNNLGTNWVNPGYPVAKGE